VGGVRLCVFVCIVCVVLSVCVCVQTARFIQEVRTSQILIG
jgi:hypothetical protein